MGILEGIIGLVHKIFGKSGNIEDIPTAGNKLKGRSATEESNESDVEELMEEEDFSTSGMQQSDKLFFKAQVKKMLRLVENIPPEIEELLMKLPEEKLSELEGDLNSAKAEAEKMGIEMFDYHTGELTEQGKDVMLQSYYNSLGVGPDKGEKEIKNVEQSAGFVNFLRKEYGLEMDSYNSLTDEEKEIIKKKYLYSSDKTMFKKIDKSKANTISESEHKPKTPEFENFLQTEYAINHEMYKALSKNEVMIINKKYNYKHPS